MDPRAIFNAVEILSKTNKDLAESLIEIAEDTIIADRLEDIAIDGCFCGFLAAKASAEFSISVNS